MGNNDSCQLGLGTNTQSLRIGGLSMGDEEQSGRPASVISIFITWAVMCPRLSGKKFESEAT